MWDFVKQLTNAASTTLNTSSSTVPPASCSSSSSTTATSVSSPSPPPPPPSSLSSDLVRLLWASPSVPARRHEERGAVLQNREERSHPNTRNGKRTPSRTASVASSSSSLQVGELFDKKQANPLGTPSLVGKEHTTSATSQAYSPQAASLDTPVPTHTALLSQGLELEEDPSHAAVEDTSLTIPSLGMRAMSPPPPLMSNELSSVESRASSFSAVSDPGASLIPHEEEGAKRRHAGVRVPQGQLPVPPFFHLERVPLPFHRDFSTRSWDTWKAGKRKPKHGRHLTPPDGLPSTRSLDDCRAMSSDCCGSGSEEKEEEETTAFATHLAVTCVVAHANMVVMGTRGGEVMVCCATTPQGNDVHTGAKLFRFPFTASHVPRDLSAHSSSSSRSSSSSSSSSSSLSPFPSPPPPSSSRWKKHRFSGIHKQQEIVAMSVMDGEEPVYSALHPMERVAHRYHSCLTYLAVADKGGVMSVHRLWKGHCEQWMELQFRREVHAAIASHRTRDPRCDGRGYGARSHDTPRQSHPHDKTPKDRIRERGTSLVRASRPSREAHGRRSDGGSYFTSPPAPTSTVPTTTSASVSPRASTIAGPVLPSSMQITSVALHPLYDGTAAFPCICARGVEVVALTVPLPPASRRCVSFSSSSSSDSFVESATSRCASQEKNMEKSEQEKEANDATMDPSVTNTRRKRRTHCQKETATSKEAHEGPLHLSGEGEEEWTGGGGRSMTPAVEILWPTAATSALAKRQREGCILHVCWRPLPITESSVSPSFLPSSASFVLEEEHPAKDEDERRNARRSRPAHVEALLVWMTSDLEVFLYHYLSRQVLRVWSFPSAIPTPMPGSSSGKAITRSTTAMTGTVETSGSLLPPAALSSILMAPVAATTVVAPAVGSTVSTTFVTSSVGVTNLSFTEGSQKGIEPSNDHTTANAGEPPYAFSPHLEAFSPEEVSCRFGSTASSSPPPSLLPPPPPPPVSLRPYCTSLEWEDTSRLLVNWGTCIQVVEMTPDWISEVANLSALSASERDGSGGETRVPRQQGNIRMIRSVFLSAPEVVTEEKERKTLQQDEKENSDTKKEERCLHLDPTAEASLVPSFHRFRRERRASREERRPPAEEETHFKLSQPSMELPSSAGGPPFSPLLASTTKTGTQRTPLPREGSAPRTSPDPVTHVLPSPSSLPSRLGRRGSDGSLTSSPSPATRTTMVGGTVVAYFKSAISTVAGEWGRGGGKEPTNTTPGGGTQYHIRVHAIHIHPAIPWGHPGVRSRTSRVAFMDGVVHALPPPTSTAASLPLEAATGCPHSTWTEEKETGEGEAIPELIARLLPYGNSTYLMITLRLLVQQKEEEEPYSTTTTGSTRRRNSGEGGAARGMPRTDSSRDTKTRGTPGTSGWSLPTPASSPAASFFSLLSVKEERGKDEKEPRLQPTESRGREANERRGRGSLLAGVTSPVGRMPSSAAALSSSRTLTWEESQKREVELQEDALVRWWLKGSRETSPLGTSAPPVAAAACDQHQPPITETSRKERNISVEELENEPCGTFAILPLVTAVTCRIVDRQTLQPARGRAWEKTRYKDGTRGDDGSVLMFSTCIPLSVPMALGFASFVNFAAPPLCASFPLTSSGSSFASTLQSDASSASFVSTSGKRPPPPPSEKSTKSSPPPFLVLQKHLEEEYPRQGTHVILHVWHSVIHLAPPSPAEKMKVLLQACEHAWWVCTEDDDDQEQPRHQRTTGQLRHHRTHRNRDGVSSHTAFLPVEALTEPRDEVFHPLSPALMEDQKEGDVFSKHTATPAGEDTTTTVADARVTEEDPSAGRGMDGSSPSRALFNVTSSSPSHSPRFSPEWDIAFGYAEQAYQLAIAYLTQVRNTTTASPALRLRATRLEEKSTRYHGTTSAMAFPLRRGWEEEQDATRWTIDPEAEAAALVSLEYMIAIAWEREPHDETGVRSGSINPARETGERKERTLEGASTGSPSCSSFVAGSTTYCAWKSWSLLKTYMKRLVEMEVLHIPSIPLTVTLRSITSTPMIPTSMRTSCITSRSFPTGATAHLFWILLEQTLEEGTTTSGRLLRWLLGGSLDGGVTGEEEAVVEGTLSLSSFTPIFPGDTWDGDAAEYTETAEGPWETCMEKRELLISWRWWNVWWPWVQRLFSIGEVGWMVEVLPDSLPSSPLFSMRNGKRNERTRNHHRHPLLIPRVRTATTSAPPMKKEGNALPNASERAAEDEVDMAPSSTPPPLEEAKVGKGETSATGPFSSTPPWRSALPPSRLAAETTWQLFPADLYHIVLLYNLVCGGEERDGERERRGLSYFRQGIHRFALIVDLEKMAHAVRMCIWWEQQQEASPGTPHDTVDEEEETRVLGDMVAPPLRHHSSPGGAASRTSYLAALWDAYSELLLLLHRPDEAWEIMKANHGSELVFPYIRTMFSISSPSYPSPPHMTSDWRTFLSKHIRLLYHQHSRRETIQLLLDSTSCEESSRTTDPTSPRFSSFSGKQRKNVPTPPGIPTLAGPLPTMDVEEMYRLLWSQDKACLWDYLRTRTCASNPEGGPVTSTTTRARTKAAPVASPHQKKQKKRGDVEGKSARMAQHTALPSSMPTSWEAGVLRKEPSSTGRTRPTTMGEQSGTTRPTPPLSGCPTGAAYSPVASSFPSLSVAFTIPPPPPPPPSWTLPGVPTVASHSGLLDMAPLHRLLGTHRREVLQLWLAFGTPQDMLLLLQGEYAGMLEGDEERLYYMVLSTLNHRSDRTSSSLLAWTMVCAFLLARLGEEKAGLLLCLSTLRCPQVAIEYVAQLPPRRRVRWHRQEKKRKNAATPHRTGMSTTTTSSSSWKEGNATRYSNKPVKTEKKAEEESTAEDDDMEEEDVKEMEGEEETEERRAMLFREIVDWCVSNDNEKAQGVLALDPNGWTCGMALPSVEHLPSPPDGTVLHLCTSPLDTYASVAASYGCSAVDVEEATRHAMYYQSATPTAFHYLQQQQQQNEDEEPPSDLLHRDGFRTAGYEEEEEENECKANYPTRPPSSCSRAGATPSYLVMPRTSFCTGLLVALSLATAASSSSSTAAPSPSSLCLPSLLYQSSSQENMTPREKDPPPKSASKRLAPPLPRTTFPPSRSPFFFFFSSSSFSSASLSFINMTYVLSRFTRFSIQIPCLAQHLTTLLNGWKQHAHFYQKVADVLHQDVSHSYGVLHRQRTAAIRVDPTSTTCPTCLLPLCTERKEIYVSGCCHCFHQACVGKGIPSFMERVHRKRYTGVQAWFQVHENTHNGIPYPAVLGKKEAGLIEQVLSPPPPFTDEEDHSTKEKEAETNALEKKDTIHKASNLNTTAPSSQMYTDRLVAGVASIPLPFCPVCVRVR